MPKNSHRRAAPITIEKVAGTPLRISSVDVELTRIGDQAPSEDLLHHRRVLNRERLVEAEVLPDVGDQLRSCVLAGDPPRRGVAAAARRNHEDDEYEHRAGEQHQNHPSQTPEDEAEHQTPSVSTAASGSTLPVRASSLDLRLRI